MRIINKQGFHNLFLSYLGMVVAFVITILRVKLITPEEIGLLSLILTLAAVLQHVVLIGLPATILKYYSKYKNEIAEKSSFILFCFLLPVLLFLIICLVYYFNREYFLGFFEDNILIEKYFSFLYFILFGEFLNALFSIIFQAEHRSVLSNFIHEQLGKYIHLFVLFGMFIYPLSFEMYFYINIVLIFIRLSVFVYYFLKTIACAMPKMTFFNKKRLLEYLEYSSFMFLSGAAGVLIASVDKVMVSSYLSLSDLGVYSIALAIGGVLEIIGRSFARITHPIIAEYWDAQNIAKIKEIYRDNANLQLSLGLFLFSVFLIFSDNIMNALGKDYLAGSMVLIFISFGSLVNVGTGMCGGIIAFSKKYRVDFYTRFLLLLVAVVTNIIFIPMFGIVGAAFATALALTFYNVIKVIYVWKVFKMQPYDRLTRNIILTNLFFLGVMYLLREYLDVAHIAYVITAVFVLGIFYILSNIFIVKNEPVRDLFKSLIAK